jgi:hypothetical protein
MLGKDGDFHPDISRPKHVTAAERTNCRHSRAYYVESKRRARLTPAEQAEYMRNVEETFRTRLGDDGQWYYEMLGECYIHGMMDGEAMAHQNDKGIPWRVFEIR